MSWDSYVNKLTTGDMAVMVDDAAIWGRTAGQESEWSSSSGLSQISAAEIRAMCDDVSKGFTTGFKIAGKKCTLLRDSLEDESSYSLIMSTKSDQGTIPVIVAKTVQAFIIVFGKPNVKAQQILPAVHRIVTYLRGTQF